MKTLELYDGIILFENNSVKLVGNMDLLLEDDQNDKNNNNTEQKSTSTEQGNSTKQNDQTKKDAGITIFKNFGQVIKYFNGNEKTIARIEKSFEDNKKKLENGSLKDKFIYYASKLVPILSILHRALIKAFGVIWNAIKKIPGVSTISEKVSNWLNKTGIPHMRVFGSSVRVADLTKFIATSFILVGSIGFIVKKVKEKYSKGNSNGKMESETLVIKPMVFTESDDVGDSFLKKGSGILAKIANVFKNITDSVGKIIIGIVSAMIAAGLLVLMLILTKNLVIKAIKYTVKYESNKIEKSGFNKAKYVGAKVVAAAAKIVTFNSVAPIDIYLTDECIDQERSIKQKRFVLTNDCLNDNNNNNSNNNNSQ